MTNFKLFMSDALTITRDLGEPKNDLKAHILEIDKVQYELASGQKHKKE